MFNQTCCIATSRALVDLHICSETGAAETNLRNSAAIPDFHLTSHYDSTGAGTADLIADCNVYRKWDDLTRRTTSCIATTRALVDSRTQTHFGEKKTARTEWPDSGRQLSPGLPDAPLLTGPLSILRLSRGHPAVASGRLRTRRRSLGQPLRRLRRAAAAAVPARLQCSRPVSCDTAGPTGPGRTCPTGGPVCGD